MASGQVDAGEVITATVLDDGTGLTFSKDRPIEGTGAAG
jgi:hypothetical protein